MPQNDSSFFKHKLGKFLFNKKNTRKKLAKAIQAKDIDKAMGYADDLSMLYSTPRKAHIFLRVLGKGSEQTSDRFYSMKQFILNNPEDKEMANYLYKKYYLKNVKGKYIRKIFRKINKKFHTKVFTQSQYVFGDLEQLKYGKVYGKLYPEFCKFLLKDERRMKATEELLKEYEGKFIDIYSLPSKIKEKVKELYG